MIKQPEWAANSEPAHRAAEREEFAHMNGGWNPNAVRTSSLPVSNHVIEFGNPFKSGFFLGLGFFTAALVISIVAFAIVVIIAAAAGASFFHAATIVNNG